VTAPRLLIVTTVPATLKHFLLPYAREMRSRGWQVDALTGEADGGTPPEVLDAFDEVVTTRWQRDLKHPRTWAGAPRHVRALLLRERYDVVHTHTPIASFVLRLVVASLPRSRRPAVCYTAHGFHFHPLQRPVLNVAFRGAERVAGRWTDRLLVINEVDREAATRHRIVPVERVVHVPGIGIDLDHYRPTAELLAAAESLRGELGLAPPQPLFSVVAALAPGKGHVDVVRAFGAVAKELDAVLAFAGSGPVREAIEREADLLGVADRLVMLGSLQDVRPLVLASRATVLASWREGLSRSVLESLALGVPVIGSRIRGIADTAGWPGAGVLVTPGDVAALSEAMREVQGFPGPQELRSHLEPRLSEYGVQPLLARHAELYEQLAARRTASTGS
jgi:glycosyltransferase involved in cell wall biosynthesis